MYKSDVVKSLSGFFIMSFSKNLSIMSPGFLLSIHFQHKFNIMITRNIFICLNHIAMNLQLWVGGME